MIRAVKRREAYVTAASFAFVIVAGPIGQPGRGVMTTTPRPGSAGSRRTLDPQLIGFV